MSCIHGGLKLDTHGQVHRRRQAWPKTMLGRPSCRVFSKTVVAAPLTRWYVVDGVWLRWIEQQLARCRTHRSTPWAPCLNSQPVPYVRLGSYRHIHAHIRTYIRSSTYCTYTHQFTAPGIASDSCLCFGVLHHNGELRTTISNRGMPFPAQLARLQ